MSNAQRRIVILILIIQLVPLETFAQTVCNAVGSGSVCGIKKIAEATQLAEDVYVYKGIQYATLGEVPWKAATKVTSYGPNTPAYRFGASCPQMRDGAAIGEAECLFLNIWTPAPPTQKTGQAGKLPVMVFIHGGAFVFGSGNESTADGTYLYDGTHFAGQQGVVLVTLNYRLGAYGFMPLNSDGAAAPFGGNLGLQDQAVALQWVQDNIHQFGGDKTQVTIFGESAGAMSVGFHLTTIASSASLFRAAIMESNPLGYQYRTSQQGTVDAKAYFRCLNAVMSGRGGCQGSRGRPSQTPTAKQVLLAQERFIKANRLQRIAASGLPEALLLSPIVDGNYVSGQPNGVIGDATKPVLVGFNRDEGVLFGALAGRQFGPGGYEWLLDMMFQDSKKIRTDRAFANRYRARKVKKLPGVATRADQALANVITDFAFHCPNMEIRSSTASGSPIWLYAFDANSAVTPVPACAPSTGNACHSSELTYVFNSAPATGPTKQLAQTMNAAWANFAKNPVTGPGSDWTPWSWSGGKPGLLNQLTLSGLANVPASGLAGLYSAANCDYWKDAKIINKKRRG